MSTRAPSRVLRALALALAGACASDPAHAPSDEASLAGADPTPPAPTNTRELVVDVGVATRFIEPLSDLPDAADPLGWVAFDHDLAADRGKGDPRHGDRTGGWQDGTFASGFGGRDDKAAAAHPEAVRSIYTRTRFTVEDATRIRGMLLNIDFDDAYAAWLNGTEIARSANLDGLDLRFDTVPTQPREAIGDLAMRVDLTAHSRALVSGENILALAVWNAEPDTDDLNLAPRLTLLGAPAEPPPQPFGEILTWAGDTSTTMTVNFQTWTTDADTQVLYDTQPHGGDPAAYPLRARATRRTVPGLELYSPRAVHHATLTGLGPNTTYWFVAGSASTGYTKERAFRTLPRGKAAIRFVAGGDMGVSTESFALMRQAASAGPHFVAIGGDVSYANGELRLYRRWDQWLEAWSRVMVTGEGITIPAVVAIGNHEVKGGLGGTLADAPFWSTYLEQGGSTYFSRRFTRDVALVVLDTGHVAPHGPEQAEWLEAELQASDDAAYLLAMYHIPLFPGQRDPGADASVAGRKLWQPLFDAHRLTAAFENHDHVFKRSHPIRGADVVPDGTVYLGDGAMGVEPRDGAQAGAPYLARVESKRHLWLVDTDIPDDEGKIGIRLIALDEHGKRFDEVHLPRR